jgi:hypothetical protein
MPIPKVKANEIEEEYISRCISEISSEYTEEGQPYAICKGEFDNPTELAQHETEPILDELPEVKSGETEDRYVQRCIPSLYPAKFDQQQAASYCADHYSNKATLGLKKASSFDRVALKLRGIKIN